MKLSLYFFIILLLSSFAYAEIQDEDIYNSEFVDINLKISSGFEIIPTSSDYSMTSISASLSYFPRNDILQEVDSFNEEPDAEIIDDNFVFTWEEPSIGTHYFSLETDVRVENKMAVFTEKIPFPADIPNEVLEYTRPSSKIDSDNSKIIEKASELVEGETDLFAAVYKLAWWTKNEITYNLTTLTIEASEKSSWVLENKYGVCDEITNLFIGLARAVNIPARFVSGISYTNSDLFEERWGSHGWAEVYFPGTGWVPFDVTYGEFGYVDASHIKLSSSLDSNESSISYEWRSRNINVETIPLEFDTKIIASHGKIEDQFTFTANVLRNNAGFNSYNLVEVKLSNPTNYYLPAQVYISKTEGLTMEDDFSKEVLLPPGEERTVYWIVKVDELNPDYIYTFPIEVYTQRGKKEIVQFKSENSFTSYSLEEIEEYASGLEDIDEKIYSSDVEFSCTPTSDYFYLGDDFTVSCTVSNKGNTLLKNLELCMENDCEFLDLGIGKTFVMKLNSDAVKTGEFEKTIYLKGILVSAFDDVNITVYDDPSIEIKELEYTGYVDYGENTSIFFTISKKSFFPPKDVKVTLSNIHTEKIWDVETLDNDKDFVVFLDTKDLSRKNVFELDIRYYDLDGEEYTESETFVISLKDLSFKQSTIVFTKDILRFIDSNLILSTVIMTALIFIMIIMIIFGRKKYDLDAYEKKIESETDEEFLKEVEEEEKEDEKLFD